MVRHTHGQPWRQGATSRNGEKRLVEGSPRPGARKNSPQLLSRRISPQHRSDGIQPAAASQGPNENPFLRPASEQGLCGMDAQGSPPGKSRL
jgi:hypothetical protein